MKLIKLNLMMLLVLLMVGCAAPVKLNTEAIDTPAKGLAASIAEWEGLVDTMYNLRYNKIIVPGTARHKKTKDLLDTGQSALEAALAALRLGDLSKAENQEAVFRSSLLLLRKEIASEQTNGR